MKPHHDPPDAEAGATSTEYALILAVILIVIIFAALAVGQQASALFSYLAPKVTP